MQTRGLPGWAGNQLTPCWMEKKKGLILLEWWSAPPVLCHPMTVFEKNNRVHYDNRDIRKQKVSSQASLWLHPQPPVETGGYESCSERNWPQSEQQPAFPPSIPLAPPAAHYLLNFPPLLKISINSQAMGFSLKKYFFKKRFLGWNSNSSLIKTGILNIWFSVFKCILNPGSFSLISPWSVVLELLFRVTNELLHPLTQSVFPSGGSKMSLPGSTLFPA